MGEVPFQVARDASESDVRTLAESGQKQVGRRPDCSFGGRQRQRNGRSDEDTAPRREPFWGLLLAALVVLLAGELLLSGGLARQRHGFAVSAH